MLPTLTCLFLYKPTGFSSSSKQEVLMSVLIEAGRVCGSSSCQVMIPANVFSGRGSALFMNLLSPASFSSLRLYLDLAAFWMQYPGSRQGDTSMLQRATVAHFHTSSGSRFLTQTHHNVQVWLRLFSTEVLLYSLMSSYLMCKRGLCCTSSCDGSAPALEWLRGRGKAIGQFWFLCFHH